MSELREAVNIVAELRGKSAVLIELQVQRIIAQSESEALQEHVAKLGPANEPNWRRLPRSAPGQWTHDHLRR